MVIMVDKNGSISHASVCGGPWDWWHTTRWHHPSSYFLSPSNRAKIRGLISSRFSSHSNCAEISCSDPFFWHRASAHKSKCLNSSSPFAHSYCAEFRCWQYSRFWNPKKLAALKYWEVLVQFVVGTQCSKQQNIIEKLGLGREKNVTMNRKAAPSKTLGCSI